MQLVLIADAFSPLRTSAAVQLRDLSREFVRQGHQLTVLLPEYDQVEHWQLEQFDGVEVLRLKAPKTKGLGYIRRTLAEFAMPFAMMRNLKRSPHANIKWDGVVWYSPSIFHGPLVSALKRSSGCKSYLIIRDIFPEWALDMNLMGRGLPYLFFKIVANYQYAVADVIGVQTPGNLKYFKGIAHRKRIEVLPNWLGKPVTVPCSIEVQKTPLAGRTLFVYAGNMGIAQGTDILLDLADKLKNRLDVGFLFVGRGSNMAHLKLITQTRQLDNVLFFDEIHPDEIPNLYAQCKVGIVALDARHRSHNIPGKFLTYMQNGLPVLANVNAGNDLARLIRNEQVGQVCDNNLVDELLKLANTLLYQIEVDAGLGRRCSNLFEKEFGVERTVHQILAALINRCETKREQDIAE